MKKLSRMEYVTRPLVATLLSLSLVILLASGAQAAVNCATCHGVLAGDGVTGLDAHPVDTPPGSLPTYRNITTGAVKGNHNTHSSPSMNANVCTKCHGAAVTSYTTKHAVLNHYSIQVTPTVNYNKGTGVVTAFPQTDSPVLGNCSNVNCHFNTVTPQWGSAPLGAASLSNTCGTCHNALPTTGSHDVHLATVGNTLSGCAQCHADHGAAAKPFQHATSAGRRPIALASSFGYTGSDNNYLVATGRTYGSCSTASCHADPYSAGVIATPVWGDTTKGCAACHTGTKVITATGPATGSHALAGHAAACITCHAAGTTLTTAPSVDHADGNIDVANVGYPANKVKGSAGASCSAASCHVSPVSTTLIATPNWGSTGNGCAACHTGVNALTATGPATGSHALAGHAAACITCHAAGTTLTTAPSVGHADGNIDVANVGYPVDKVKGSAGASCSAASCHVSPVSTTLIATP
ncbi:MAG: CxxxxCH/CxxCH domain-containing protein, partial [Desulfuromonadaceae bacterium]|nr:CxxxxCH/CxxCH domain-containing protein [Desulfuromonadaceae bacterium]